MNSPARIENKAQPADVSLPFSYQKPQLARLSFPQLVRIRLNVLAPINLIAIIKVLTSASYRVRIGGCWHQSAIGRIAPDSRQASRLNYATARSSSAAQRLPIIAAGQPTMSALHGRSHRRTSTSLPARCATVSRRFHSSDSVARS